MEKISNYPIYVLPISLITPEHIDKLLEDEAPESLFLDYKSKLYGASDSEKVQLLKHVCGFINANGGLLIFGIHEVGGIPISAPGLEVIPEHTIQTIQVLVHECIEPPPAALELRVLPYRGVLLLLLSMAKSLNGPHAVNFQKHQRFYTRFGSSTVPMSMHEVRDKFWESSLVRMQAFPGSHLAPANTDFIQELYNLVANGDSDEALKILLNYIVEANAVVGSRDSNFNAFFFDADGRLCTTEKLQDFALWEAKANTYFKGVVNKIGDAINQIRMLHSFLEKADKLSTETLTNIERINSNYQGDVSYQSLIFELEQLLNSLKRN